MPVLESGSDGLVWTPVPAAQTHSVSAAGGLTLLRSPVPVTAGGRLFFRQRINYAGQR